MESYKKLFRTTGFTFGGNYYGKKSYVQNYYDLVRDVLNGKYDGIPSSDKLSKMFMSTIYLEYDNLPKSVKDRKLYKELGDIYVLTNKDIKGLNAAIARIGKHLNKPFEIHQR
jgi:hypothetical protein